MLHDHTASAGLHQIAFAKAQAVTNMVMEALEAWREQTLRDQRALVVHAFEEAITRSDVISDVELIDYVANDIMERWKGDRTVRLKEAIATIDPHFIVDYPQQLPALGRIMGEIFDEATDRLREEIDRSATMAKRNW